MRETSFCISFRALCAEAAIAAAVLITPVIAAGGTDTDYADADSGNRNTKNLGTTEVRAPGEAFTPDAADFVELRAEDWEGKDFALADFLAEQTGVQAHRNGGMGSFQTVSIRGAAAKSVLICIDGIPVEDAGGGAADLGGIDLNQIEKIEIYKSYAPARFGGNGIGGVINFVTKKSVSTGGKILVSYGSHNTQELSASIHAKITDSLRFASTLAYRHSDNDYEFTNRHGTEYNTEDDTRDTRKNARYTEVSGTHSLTYAHAGGALSTLSVTHSKEWGGNPGKEANQTVVAGFDRDFAQALYRYESRDFGLWQLQAGLAGRVEKSVSHSYYPLDKIGYPYNAYLEYGAVSYLARPEIALLKSKGPREGLGFGIYMQCEAEELLPRDNNEVSSAYRWELKRKAADIALEAEKSPLPFLNLNWSASLRRTDDRKSEGVLYTPTAQDTLPAMHKRQTHWAARAAAELGEDPLPLRVFASVARYYRAPQPMELYGVREGVLSNPDLKAEEGINWDAGLRFKNDLRKISVQILYFETHAKNGILWVTSASFTKPQNIAKTRTRGVEMDFSARPVQLLGLTLRGTVQDPREISGSRTYNQKQLPEEPVKSVLAEGTLYLPLHFELSLKAEWRSRIFSDRANRERLPAQALFSASLGWHASAKTKLVFAADNLTGEEYQDIYAAYPKPGREFRGTIVQDF